MVHISKETADLLIEAGYDHWVTEPREPVRVNRLKPEYDSVVDSGTGDQNDTTVRSTVDEWKEQ